MADCDILEDLKALEPGLAERQDLLNALNSLRGQLISDSSGSETSRFGIKITPSAPRFHPNFPGILEIPIVKDDLEVTELKDLFALNGTLADGRPYWQATWEEFVLINRTRAAEDPSDLYFNIIPGDLNCFPVWDSALKKTTNGIEDNEAFDCLYKGQSVFFNGPFELSVTNPPLIDSTNKRINDAYRADPNNPKWQKWSYVSGGRLDEKTLKTIDDPANPIVWESYQLRPELIEEGTIKFWVDVDKITGECAVSVSFFNVFPSNGLNSFWDIPLTLVIKNGNGQVQRPLTIRVTPIPTGSIWSGDVIDISNQSSNQ